MTIKRATDVSEHKRAAILPTVPSDASTSAPTDGAPESELFVFILAGWALRLSIERRPASAM